MEAEVATFFGRAANGLNGNAAGGGGGSGADGAVIAEIGGADLAFSMQWSCWKIQSVLVRSSC